MARCATCGKEVFGFSLQGGKCLLCSERERRGILFKDPVAEVEQANALRSDTEALHAAAEQVILTTETAHNLPVLDRLDIVTAEVVIGMHLFKDIASAFRDTFGGRSKLMQDGLRDARKTALTELRREAHALGADAVVGIDLDYSEISGHGKSMLFLVASGTAVTLEKATDGA